jgi:cytochrome c biogenesis protein CcdA
MTTNTLTMSDQIRGISLLGVGHATSLLLAISFVLCVGFDLLFPEHAMYGTWQQLLPGFEWLSWKGFFLGLVEAYGYGWFFALIWVPIYNYVTLRGR